MVRPRTLPEALLEAAQSAEGYTFGGQETQSRRSYSQMLNSARRVAGALRKKGLQPGALVALVIGDSEQFLSTLFGASLGGLIPASLYPPAIVSDLRFYLETTSRVVCGAGARAVVTTSKLAPALEGLRATDGSLQVISYADLDSPDANDGNENGGGLNQPLVSIDDIAFVQFTSGSTSAPKGVAITHRNLSANIDAINGPAGLGVSVSDVGVSWLPLYHDMGLVGMALGAMYSRRPMVLLPPESFVKRPGAWLRAISQHRASVSFAPNFAYDLCVRRVSDRDLEGVDLSSWRVAGCGGEPIHAPTLAAFAERFRDAGFRETSFVPSYGLAEHVLAATLAPTNRIMRIEHLRANDIAERAVATPAEGSEAERVTVVSCGGPLPGHDIRIVDEHGRAVNERAIGEITLAGPSLMLGYYNDEALTAETIRDGRLHTGDLGYVSDGELFICGRIKDVVVIRGRKYHPQDLEWAVDDVPGIRRGRVVAFGTSRPGESDSVVLVAEPISSRATDGLASAIRQRIVDVCGLPVDEVLLVEKGTITRTTSGKVQRAAIKARYESGDLRSCEAAG
jgi:fatty-acyl-CoA synthase